MTKISDGRGIGVGAIGLGAMGARMAASLRRRGYNVHVFDIRSEVATSLRRTAVPPAPLWPSWGCSVMWWCRSSSTRPKLRACCLARKKTAWATTLLLLAAAPPR